MFELVVVQHNAQEKRPYILFFFKVRRHITGLIGLFITQPSQLYVDQKLGSLSACYSLIVLEPDVDATKDGGSRIVRFIVLGVYTST